MSPELLSIGMTPPSIASFAGSRPTTLPDAVATLISAQPRFAELAQDLHAAPNEWVNGLDRLRAQCSLQWSMIPERDLPEASRADVLALALCSLRHALVSHSSCSPPRRTVISQALALPEDADPLAPLLPLLLRGPCGKDDDEVLAQIRQARPVLLLVGSVLAVQDELGFRAVCDRLLAAVSSQGSPFTLAATPHARTPVMRSIAKLAICNQLLRTPGLPEQRRAHLMSTFTSVDIRRATPVLDACNDGPAARRFGMR